MKKLLSFVLALTMMFATSINVFAGNINEFAGTDSTEVTTTYNNLLNNHVISVSVTWGAMEFKYTEPTKTWSTETHKWTNNDNEKWEIVGEDESNQITIQSDSSCTINAGFNFTIENDNYTNIVGTFKNITDNANSKITDLELETPTANANAKEYTIAFMPSGVATDLDLCIGDKTKLGTITITLGSYSDGSTQYNGPVTVTE